MYYNSSPIDLRFLQEDDISSLSQEVLDIFTRKVIRARDAIRTHHDRLLCENQILAKRLKTIFFSTYVTSIITQIEGYPIHKRWPRQDTETVVSAIIQTLSPTDKYEDPFALIPYF